MDKAPESHDLTRRDLEAVIRRAAELEAEAGSRVPELSETDVVRIAGEVGLSEASVRRALAELRAGAGGGLLADRGWAARLCGPGLVTATRILERPSEEVRQEIEAHFRENESLRLARRTRGVSLWEPDSGVIASIVRSVDLSGAGYQLAKKSQALELGVIPLNEGSCQVTLTADLGKERGAWFWVLGIGTGGALATGASIFITGLPSLPDVVALGSPALLGLTMGMARRAYMRAMEKMRLILDGLLDRLEHDEPLRSPRPSWRDLLK
jgi:hypothetical protein